MRIFVGLFLASFGVLIASTAKAGLKEDAAAYGTLQNVQYMDISPDGSKIAFLAGNTREERSLVVYSLDGGSPTRVPLEGQRGVDVRWFSNDRVSVGIFEYREEFGQEYNTFRRLIMDPDGGNQREITPGVLPTDYMRDDPEHVLMEAGGIQLDERSRSKTELYRQTDLYKLNVKTGKARRVQSGKQGTIGWLLSPDGEPFLRYDEDAEADLGDGFRLKTKKIDVYSKASGGWKKVYSSRVRSDDVGDEESSKFLSIRGFRVGTDEIYATGRQGNDDKISLYRFDPVSGDVIGPIFTPERNDLDAIYSDPHTNYLLGYGWTEGERKVVWWDDEIAQIHGDLKEAFPGSEISFSGWDETRSRFVVQVSGGTVAMNYYLYQPKARSLSKLASAYPNIPDEQVNPVQYIEYEARDGVPITAYLTLPKNREAKDLPLIMLPHGGPQARDFPGFDHWSQFLSRLGYAVIQPQFRHSDGFGFKFIKLGYGRWGREPQTDLSDGIDYLAEQGIVDPSRVCIFGWSYGGYAALAGATITPEDYRCAVAGAPVSDLIRMLQWEEEEGGSSGGAATYWQTAIGSRFADTKELEFYSPADRVEEVRFPIMLQHGKIDDIVPIEQSEIMAEALKKAGKPYEFVVLEGENHNLLYGETRTEQLETMGRFLMTHNPPYKK